MKNKTLKIKFRDLASLKVITEKALEKALELGEKTINPSDEIIFSSYKDYLKAMSDQKYAILAVIKNKKPMSIYQLAKIIGREFPNVKRDCDYLEQLGFIHQKRLNDSKNTKIPELVFDYDQIVILAPNFTYGVTLAPEKAA